MFFCPFVQELITFYVCKMIKYLLLFLIYGVGDGHGGDGWVYFKGSVSRQSV